MKLKAIIISSVAVFVALCVAVVGFSLAWYSNTATSDLNLELNADGYILVYYEDDITSPNCALKPAVATLNDVRDGVDFTQVDVLSVGEHILEPATVATYTTVFHYINASEDNKSYRIDFVKSAKMIFSEIDPSTSKPKEMDMMVDNESNNPNDDYRRKDIAISAQAHVVYTDGTPSPADIDIVWGENQSTLILDRNATVTLTVSAHLLQPDELAQPKLLDANKIRITVSIKANQVM